MTSCKITSDHISTALRWLNDESCCEKWNLSTKEQARLLGVNESTYTRWRKKAQEGQSVEVPRDVQDRLSYLLGIMKGLKALAPIERPDLAYDWFKTPNKNPVFQDRSIRDYLLGSGSMISMHNTKSYLEKALGV